MTDDAPLQLIMEMRPDIDRFTSGEDVDFQAKYEAALRQVGAVPLLTELFSRYEGIVLSTYLGRITFLWKDLSFADWREVLYRISGSTQAVYQFVWFAAPFLGIDVLSMINHDPKVDMRAREFIRVEFPKGAPKAGGSWEREVLEENGVDPLALWQRLAAEGAPMKVDLTKPV